MPPLSPSGQRLYQRYVAGELSLAQCSAYLRQRDNPAQPLRSSRQGTLQAKGLTGKA